MTLTQRAEAGLRSIAMPILNIFIRTTALWAILNHYGLWAKFTSGAFPATADLTDWFGAGIVLVLILSFFRRPPVKSAPVQQSQEHEQPVLFVQLSLLDEIFENIGDEPGYSITRSGTGWTFSIQSKQWSTAKLKEYFESSDDDGPESAIENFITYARGVDFKIFKQKP